VSLCKGFHVKKIFSCVAGDEKVGGTLYAIGVIIIILWAIGFLFYNMGAIIHLLLPIAVILILYRIVRSGKDT
jgi:hypothetical protein